MKLKLEEEEEEGLICSVMKPRHVVRIEPTAPDPAPAYYRTSSAV